jgi:hypothetical protein
LMVATASWLMQSIGKATRSARPISAGSSAAPCSMPPSW